MPQRLDMGMYRDNSDGGYFLSYMPTAPRGFTLSVVVPGQATRLIAHSSGQHEPERPGHVTPWTGSAIATGA